MSQGTKRRRSFRLLDLFIIIIFLSIAVLCLEGFRRDLLQTFNLLNEEPVGTIIVKRNIVQRRLADRVIWDRLTNESPVYIGDIIRVADISSAMLNIDANNIDIDENTLIRISRSADGEGFMLILSEGSLSLAADVNSKSITLDLNGQRIITGHSTVLSAAVGNDRQFIQINEGIAQFVSSTGEVREITQGSFISMDLDGRQQLDRAVVITHPQPNARYVKPTSAPMPVNISWNRINLEPQMSLRLEIAQDRSFTRISDSINYLDRNTQILFDSGLWFYRVLYQSEVLGTGQLTVADGSGPQLVSPAFNSIFYYQEAIESGNSNGNMDEPPIIIFQWAAIEEATSYILEISSFADFSLTQIRMNNSSTSQVISNLDHGMWFWRVKPVFLPIFSGESSFSSAAFFRIEQRDINNAGRDTSLSAWLSSVIPSLELPSDLPSQIIQVRNVESVTPPAPSVNINYPVNGAQIAGLTALRQQIEFSWDIEGILDDLEITSSRFILSRNANPLSSPSTIIDNPSSTVSIENLSTGVWYWTVEINIGDWFTTSAPVHRFQVLPIPLLPSVSNLLPSGNSRLSNTDLLQRSITFRWSSVQGANAYIFTLYQQNQGIRNQLDRTIINNRTNYTISNMRLFNRGTFVWQIEPVNIRDSIIEQRGVVTEGTFIIDIPSPGQVQIDDTGIMYGN